MIVLGEKNFLWHYWNNDSLIDIIIIYNIDK